jgi:signal transduction histidine kinase
MALSFANKLIILFSTIVLGTIAGGVMTYLSQGQVKANNNWVEHTVAVLYESEKAFSLMQDIALVERGYAITGDSNYLIKFVEKIRRTYTSVYVLENLVQDNTIQTKRVESLKKMIFDKIILSKKNIAIRQQKGIVVAMQVIKAYKSIGNIRNLTAQIQVEENRLLSQRQKTSLASYYTFTYSLYTLIGFTILLLLITLFMVWHNLQQEEKLRESSILEAQSKEMEQFTYITSHELRHPLLTIQNYVTILVEEHSGTLDNTSKQYLKSVLGLTEHMNMLIQGLFEYSRLSKMKIHETVNCNAVIKTVLADLHAIIQSSNAKITIMSLPTFRASPPDIKQLFQNLITNALKFTKAGVSPELNISTKKDGDNYTFEFRDNGIGIEEKNFKKIFNIFKRVHTIEEFEGVGLGLAYCKKIVELHHGRIWVKSKPGIGSSFYFTIKTSL